jgi:hypothetical protein
VSGVSECRQALCDTSVGNDGVFADGNANERKDNAMKDERQVLNENEAGLARSRQRDERRFMQTVSSARSTCDQRLLGAPHPLQRTALRAIQECGAGGG